MKAIDTCTVLHDIISYVCEIEQLRESVNGTHNNKSGGTDKNGHQCSPAGTMTRGKRVGHKYM